MLNHSFMNLTNPANGALTARLVLAALFTRQRVFVIAFIAM